MLPRDPLDLMERERAVELMHYRAALEMEHRSAESGAASETRWQ